MALEIQRVHLFILLPVLVILSWGRATSNNVSCNICCQNSSKAICLQFYNEPTDFPSAKQACKNTNSNLTLMSESVYEGNEECVHKYLRDLNHSNTLIWLDSNTTGKRPNYVRKIFNTSGVVGTSNEENGKHSRICMEQVANESSTTTSPDCSERPTDNTTVNNKSTLQSSTPGNGYTTTAAKDNSAPNINTNTSQGTGNSKTDEDNVLSLALPVALVTAAVILSLCCIGCVACGAILYRKRDKIIRCIGRMNTSHRSVTDAAESVELRPTLDMYANINRNRPNSEKCQPKLRFLNNHRVTIENDDVIYSNVNTYSNMDQLKMLSEESSMACSQHNNTLYRSSSGPPSYSVCVPISDSQTQKELGRYVSDGLVYTTLEHTAHGRRPRPVKAKSEEHVEYITLDFEKTGKVHKKKKKPVNHSRSMEC